MTTISIPADIGKASWCSPDKKHSGRFNPSGAFGCAYSESKTRLNPENWNHKLPLYAARLFVGFNVGDVPTYEMDDLVDIVKKVRQRQVGKQDHSIVYQRGTYTSDKTGKPTDEQGGQVVILNLSDFKSTKEKFRKQMVELADAIVDEMQQELVIVEMQRNGFRYETIGVAPQSDIPSNQVEVQ